MSTLYTWFIQDHACGVSTKTQTGHSILYDPQGLAVIFSHHQVCINIYLAMCKYNCEPLWYDLLTYCTYCVHYKCSNFHLSTVRFDGVYLYIDRIIDNQCLKFIFIICFTCKTKPIMSLHDSVTKMAHY